MLNIVLGIIDSLIDSSEDLFAGPWNDALVVSIPDDRVGFPGPCLTISEEASMIAFESIIKHFLALNEEIR
jgi:hypothetical protein